MRTSAAVLLPILQAPLLLLLHLLLLLLVGAAEVAMEITAPLDKYTLTSRFELICMAKKLHGKLSARVAKLSQVDPDSPLIKITARELAFQTNVTN
jgi:hypothetical protein